MGKGKGGREGEAFEERAGFEDGEVEVKGLRGGVSEEVGEGVEEGGAGGEGEDVEGKGCGI